MDIENTLSKLTLEEKIALVQGTNFMYTNQVKRLGIKSVRMSDGPHGLRVQDESGDNGVTGSSPSTCFPTAVTTASSWNTNNLYSMGKAIGEEAGFYGINVVLGPGVCIKRNPLCGRNFEYFSEDPFLAGKLGGSEVMGINETGAGVSVKHFALNNAENFRLLGDSICDDRGIREIYLKAFEMIVKEANPSTVMCAYNKINGVHCSENDWLLNRVLRDEWGFKGLVMSDWGTTHDRVKGIKSGLDLEMPGDTLICRKWIYDSINDGTLTMEELDTAVRNVLNLVSKFENTSKADNAYFKEHNELAREIAEDSAVLLKNDGVLPLKKDEKILVVGDLFTKMRYQGAGSSMINPTYLITPKDAFDQNNVQYEFERGYEENKLEPNDKLINEAINKAKDYDIVLVFAGLTDYVESEGCDRETMCLPNNQLALIKSITNINKKVIVVTFGGSPFELPFKDKVSGILNMYLPGQAGGLATYNLLFGNKSPSGKLAETWPIHYSDVPFADEYSKTKIEVYKESIFVGYRYYLTNNVEVNYPFGYGLSYTKFKYSNIHIQKDEKKYIISCDIENIGNFDGSEVVQLYVKGPSGVLKPIKELKGFSKLSLKTGETKQAVINVDIDNLRYWNTKENRWVLEDGNYQFEICSSSVKCELSVTEHIQGEDIPSPYDKDIEDIYLSGDYSRITNSVYERLLKTKIPTLDPIMPITIESKFTDFKQSKLLGRIIYNAVQGISRSQLKKAKKLPEGVERENKIKGAIFLGRVLDNNSVIALSMCGGKSMPYNFAEGFVYFANGKFFKGLKCFLTKIKAPALPKEEEINK